MFFLVRSPRYSTVVVELVFARQGHDLVAHMPLFEAYTTRGGAIVNFGWPGRDVGCGGVVTNTVNLRSVGTARGRQLGGEMYERGRSL